MQWIFSASAASEFYDWVQVEIDVYIPYCKYQVKPHLSPWFSARCAITFFNCTKRKNLLNIN